MRDAVLLVRGAAGHAGGEIGQHLLEGQLVQLLGPLAHQRRRTPRPGRPCPWGRRAEPPSNTRLIATIGRLCRSTRKTEMPPGSEKRAELGRLQATSRRRRRAAGPGTPPRGTPARAPAASAGAAGAGAVAGAFAGAGAVAVVAAGGRGRPPERAPGRCCRRRRPARPCASSGRIESRRGASSVGSLLRRGRRSVAGPADLGRGRGLARHGDHLDPVLLLQVLGGDAADRPRRWRCGTDPGAW